MPYCLRMVFSNLLQEDQFRKIGLLCMLLHTSLLMMKSDPNALLFEEVVSILLQEDQSRKNRSIMRVANQDFIASQRGKGKAASLYSKPKLCTMQV